MFSSFSIQNSQFDTSGWQELNLLPPGSKPGMHPLHLTLIITAVGFHTSAFILYLIGREGFEPSPNRLKVCDADRYTSDPFGMRNVECGISTTTFHIRHSAFSWRKRQDSNLHSQRLTCFRDRRGANSPTLPIKYDTARPGLEPESAESKSAILPLDDQAITSSKYGGDGNRTRPGRATA